MSEQPTGVAETATGVHAGQAAENAADDADKHIPTPVEAPPKHETEPSNGDNGLSELRDTVGKLADSVATLTDLVTSKVSPDQSATAKVPWLWKGRK